MHIRFFPPGTEYCQPPAERIVFVESDPAAIISPEILPPGESQPVCCGLQPPFRALMPRKAVPGREPRQIPAGQVGEETHNRKVYLNELSADWQEKIAQGPSD